MQLKPFEGFQNWTVEPCSSRQRLFRIVLDSISPDHPAVSARPFNRQLMNDSVFRNLHGPAQSGESMQDGAAAGVHCSAEVALQDHRFMPDFACAAYHAVQNSAGRCCKGTKGTRRSCMDELTLDHRTVESHWPFGSVQDFRESEPEWLGISLRLPLARQTARDLVIEINCRQSHGSCQFRERRRHLGVKPQQPNIDGDPPIFQHSASGLYLRERGLLQKRIDLPPGPYDIDTVMAPRFRIKTHSDAGHTGPVPLHTLGIEPQHHIA